MGHLRKLSRYPYVLYAKISKMMKTILSISGDYLKLYKNGVKITVNGRRQFAENFNEKYFLVLELFHFQETVFSHHMVT